MGFPDRAGVRAGFGAGFRGKEAFLRAAAVRPGVFALPPPDVLGFAIRLTSRLLFFAMVEFLRPLPRPNRRVILPRDDTLRRRWVPAAYGVAAKVRGVGNSLISLPSKRSPLPLTGPADCL